ncbi:MAG: hypothetical protein ACR2LI_15105, partial [Propionibacteriaceae bacterium]
SSLRAVAGARAAASLLAQQACVAAVGSPSALLVGAGQPYGRREIATALALPVLGEVSDDPSAAAVLSDGERRSRQFDRSNLVRTLHHLAQQLAHGLQESADRVGAL